MARASRAAKRAAATALPHARRLGGLGSRERLTTLSRPSLATRKHALCAAPREDKDGSTRAAAVNEIGRVDGKKCTRLTETCQKQRPTMPRRDLVAPLSIETPMWAWL